MKILGFAIGFLTTLSITVSATVRYVDVNSTNAAPPYTNWVTAANVIQDAVDVADPGDQILVTNGVYQTGGRAIGANVLVNRVAVDKPLMVQSVNGRNFTIIKGNQVPGTTNGGSATRSVYLTDGASLVGFTLTNGATRTNGDLVAEQSGGGLFCESQSVSVLDCVLTGNSAFNMGGGAFSGSLSNCAIVCNSASAGGGASHAWLQNCTVKANSADGGGGAHWSTLVSCLVVSNSALSFGGGVGGVAQASCLTNCTVAFNTAQFAGGTYGSALENCLVFSNSAYFDGGGVSRSSLHNCTVSGNRAGMGIAGGAHGGELANCTLRDNSAFFAGGGASSARLIGCIVVSNSANYGAGAYESALFNSLVVGNSATTRSGGVDGCGLNNCILYYNTAPINPNHGGDSCYHSCTIPLPLDNYGSFTNAPLFVDQAGGDFHLQSNSPCINAGGNWPITNAYHPIVITADFDGNPRISGETVDVGPYEFQSPQSKISYAWLQQYGLPVDGSEDLSDADQDGHNAWQEWQADTNPTNQLSVLRLWIVSNSADGIVLQWAYTGTRSYLLRRGTNLTDEPGFLSPDSYIFDGAGTVTCVDTNINLSVPVFYRVEAGRLLF